MVRPSTRHQGVTTPLVQPTPARSALRALRSFASSYAGIGLIIALSWQILMTAIGTYFAARSGSISVGDALTSHMNHWDAGWYHHILAYAYSTDGSPAAPAFYPLFPLLVSVLSFLSFGTISPLVAGLLVNTASIWLAVVALMRILQHFTKSRRAQTVGIALFLCFPSAFFMHAFYSEAVFIALGFWAYLYALRKCWWASALLLAALSAARLPALLFIGLCLLEYARYHNWNPKQLLNRQALWFLLAPLGFVLYGTYLAIVRGDFLAMFHAYSATNDWTYHVFSPNIIGTIGAAVLSSINRTVTHELNYEVFINQLLPVATLTLLIASSIFCLVKMKSKGMALGIFGIISVVMFTLNNNVVSTHRYVLGCVVIYVAAGLLRLGGWRSIAAALLIAGSFAVQMFLYAKFISNVFAG